MTMGQAQVNIMHDRGRAKHQIAVRVLLATTVLGASLFMIGAPASAQNRPVAASSQSISFNIPPQSLARALDAFISQSGWQISYSSALVRGKQSAGIQGVITADAALNRLVSGTGIIVRISARGSAALAAEAGATDTSGDATSLQPIVLKSDRLTTEGSSSYTTTATSTAMKLPLSIRETPQSVSVVTQQKIKDKNYATLDQALQDAPGILAMQGFGDTRWEYFARGELISNIQYDGVVSPINLFTRDVLVKDDFAIYDRAEIIRGATGLTEGSGNPAASINLVRKRPTETPQYSAETSISSYGNARATVDASGAFNEAGTLRGRFVASGGAGDGFRDYFEQKNLTLYGVVDADVTEDTTISLGYSHQREDTDGYTWGGLPTRADGSFYDFSPKTYLGSDWEYLNKTQNTVYFDLEHRFDNGWKLNASARRIWADSDMLTSFTWRVGDDVRKNDRMYDYDDDQISVDVHASGQIELFGRDHDLVVGANAQREKFSYVGGSSPFYVIDPENWDPTSVPKPNITIGSIRGDLDQKEGGVYASARLNIADPFKVIVGGRLSWYTNNDIYSDDNYEEKGNLIPYIGAVYDINEMYSVYASYTEIFKPQMAYDVNGSLLDPVEGTNKEVGLKGEFMQGRLNASVALFETNQTGLAVQLDDSSLCNPGLLSCYEAADRVRTRGIDVEVTGELTPGLNLGLGYTFANAKYVEGANSGGRYSPEKSPMHIFKASLAYQLPGQLENWTIGAGIRAQSKTFAEGATYRIEQPAYAVADVMAKYTLNNATEMQLNVNNVFDKDYYSSISGLTSYGHFKGAPREFVFSLRHKF